MLSLSDLGLIGLFIGNFLAATIVPFSSDALYIGALAAMGRPWECFVVATAGNWLGSIATYYCGLIAKWEWLERTFRIEPQTIARQKPKIDRFGTWLALLAWVPFIGCAGAGSRILPHAKTANVRPAAHRQGRTVSRLDGTNYSLIARAKSTKINLPSVFVFFLRLRYSKKKESNYINI